MRIIENWKEVFFTELKFLCFLPVRPDMKRLGNHYLAFALLASWVAGLGRYWDHPNAEWWQYAGLGSVAYIFILALILWALIRPLRPANWSYRGLLVFIGMTSPPAIFYAIPVERYFDLETAQSINVWFLAVVALWRVLLYTLYLRRSAKLTWRRIAIAVPLPLILIVGTLTMANLEHAVFEVMAGMRDVEYTSNDEAYKTVILLFFASFYVFPFLVIAYGVAIGHDRSRPEAESNDDSKKTTSLCEEQPGHDDEQQPPISPE